MSFQPDLHPASLWKFTDILCLLRYGEQRQPQTLRQPHALVSHGCRHWCSSDEGNGRPRHASGAKNADTPKTPLIHAPEEVSAHAFGSRKKNRQSSMPVSELPLALLQTCFPLQPRSSQNYSPNWGLVSLKNLFNSYHGHSEYF